MWSPVVSGVMGQEIATSNRTLGVESQKELPTTMHHTSVSSQLTEDRAIALLMQRGYVAVIRYQHLHARCEKTNDERHLCLLTDVPGLTVAAFRHLVVETFRLPSYTHRISSLLPPLSVGWQQETERRETEEHVRG